MSTEKGGPASEPTDEQRGLLRALQLVEETPAWGRTSFEFKDEIVKGLEAMLDG